MPTYADACQDNKVPDGATCLLGYLLLMAGGQQTIEHLTQEDLANALGCGLRTVTRHIKTLQDGGYLTLQKRGHKPGVFTLHCKQSTDTPADTPMSDMAQQLASLADKIDVLDGVTPSDNDESLADDVAKLTDRIEDVEADLKEHSHDSADSGDDGALATLTDRVEFLEVDTIKDNRVLTQRLAKLETETAQQINELTRQLQDFQALVGNLQRPSANTPPNTPVQDTTHTWRQMLDAGDITAAFKLWYDAHGFASYAQAAKRLGIGKDTLWRYYSGKTTPRGSHLKKLVAVMLANPPAPDNATVEPETASDTEPEAVDLSAFDQRLWKAYNASRRYLHWEREHVLISDVVAHSGLDIPTVHAWLLEKFELGIACPSETGLVKAEKYPEQIEAAIEWRGEKFLQVVITREPTKA